MRVFAAGTFTTCAWMLWSLALAFAPASLGAQSPVWQVDSASIRFEIRNAGLPVHGSFRGLVADIRFDPAHPEAGALTASVDARTINTGISFRDRHLQRREYFHVEEYGALELRSLRLWKAGAGYAGTFRLKIRAVERDIEIPFDFEQTGNRSRLCGKLTLDRLEYGIGKPSRILADEVRVEVVAWLILREADPDENATPEGHHIRPD
jgi:polyisoprenoid-binding protein YceI